MITSHPPLSTVAAEMAGQDEARLEELSTYFECSESEAILRSIRFAHKAICAGPDALQRREILKAASQATALAGVSR